MCVQFRNLPSHRHVAIWLFLSNLFFLSLIRHHWRLSVKENIVKWPAPLIFLIIYKFEITKPHWALKLMLIPPPWKKRYLISSDYLWLQQNASVGRALWSSRPIRTVAEPPKIKTQCNIPCYWILKQNITTFQLRPLLSNECTSSLQI